MARNSEHGSPSGTLGTQYGTIWFALRYHRDQKQPRWYLYADQRSDLEGVDGTCNGTHIIYQVGTAEGRLCLCLCICLLCPLATLISISPYLHFS